MPAPNAWDPGHPAVWIERAPGETDPVALRHLTYPYEVDAPAVDSDTLIGIAAGYLRKVAETFGLPNLLNPNTTAFNAPLAWLPVHEDNQLPPAATPAPPLRSFWVKRYDPDSASLADRTVVILAVQSAAANDPARALGSRHGIRIAAHVSSEPPFSVRITSSARSTGLVTALGPYPTVAVKFIDDFFTTSEFRDGLRASLEKLIALDPDAELWFDGLRVVGTSGSRAVLEVYANAGRPGDHPEDDAHEDTDAPPPRRQSDRPAFAVTARILLDPSGDARLLALDKQPLIAHQAPVRARLFPRDPASRAGLGNLIDSRPNRSPARLRRYRRNQTLPGLTLGIVGDTQLRDDLNQVLVTRSRLVQPNADEALAQTVFPICVTHARLNWFAALSGYQRTRRLWDTMRGYGLDPIQYSRFALLPLRIRYRATLTRGPGKDGKTVNAEVNFDPPERDLIAVPGPINPRPIQVRFALADVKRSGSRREPLGLTADPRWSWHEYGHVLLVAWTGALQFLFAHSPGDALAAILSDPRSALATDPPRHRPGRLRGLTFPWVYLHRRHDRDVFLGWSWSGRYHRPAAFAASVNSYRRKGYQSEQILSTSLFRLYRSLGGDTVRSNGTPERRVREAAAQYTAYLIMRGIGLMSPAFLVPLQTPDQLVTALGDADTGTAPVTSGLLQGRVGGCAHKVVRWAFQAQGLYATNNPLAVVDRPGLPKDPDIFIDDRRRDSPGDFPRGGYMPVSLDWHAAPNASEWHASAQAIQVVGGQVSVEVHNRGPSTANQVTVQIWWIESPLNQPVPLWDKAAWNPLPVSAAQSVAASMPVNFGPFNLPAQPSGRRLLIVAEATCPADPANSDAASGQPCATHPTPLVDLVAGDNNLGLRLHVVP